MLIVYACKDTEAFGNVLTWAKNLGYPRPQGNLSNYKYGTKEEAKKKEQKDWRSVLNDKRFKKSEPKKNSKTQRIENLKIPFSKTILV